MPFVFGRNTAAPFGALAQIVEAMLSSPEESDRAIGWNLLHDDRVSDERAAHFYEYSNRPKTVDDLREALRQYVEQWIVERPAAETYLAGNNSCNFIHPHPRFDLGHVLNLSGLLYRLRNRSHPGVVGLDTDHLNDTERKLETATEPADLADLVEELLRLDHLTRKNRPVWAARWSDLSRHLHPSDADSWNAAVGVERNRRTWQIVVRYPARSVEALVRPTQLDIGLYMYHFPSPAALAPKLGGFAMSLRDLGNRRLPLVAEYLHPPVRMGAEWWLRSGGLCLAHSGGGSGLALQIYRRQHMERMERDRKTAAAWKEWTK